MKNKFKIKKVFLNYNTIKYQIKGIIYWVCLNYIKLLKKKNSSYTTSEILLDNGASLFGVSIIFLFYQIGLKLKKKKKI